MENKSFQIDSNIVINKKKNNRNINKNRAKKNSNNLILKVFFIVILILIGLFFFIKNYNIDLIKQFSNGKTIVCKDRLVSKDLGYLFNTSENAFINKKEGLFFSVYFCSNFDK